MLHGQKMFRVIQLGAIGRHDDVAANPFLQKVAAKWVGENHVLAIYGNSEVRRPNQDHCDNKKRRCQQPSRDARLHAARACDLLRDSAGVVVAG